MENLFQNLIYEENKRKDQKVTIANKQKMEKITKQKVIEALKKMKNNKAVGPDEIFAQSWKALGSKKINNLVELLNPIFETETIAGE